MNGRVHNLRYTGNIHKGGKKNDKNNPVGIVNGLFKQTCEAGETSLGLLLKADICLHGMLR